MWIGTTSTFYAQARSNYTPSARARCVFDTGRVVVTGDEQADAVAEIVEVTDHVTGGVALLPDVFRKDRIPKASRRRSSGRPGAGVRWPSPSASTSAGRG